MNKEGSNYENKQLIVLFMRTLDLKVNDMVKFLEVSANTVYNYRTLNNNSLPTKVTNKLFELLDVETTEEAINMLANIDYDKKNILLGKLGKSITAKTILNGDIINNTNKGIKELTTLGSKVFTDALIHEIENVVKDINDYEFIAYIRKYKKEE